MMGYLRPNTSKNHRPKAFTFIPANCDRVLTFDESLSIALGNERALEIQFYVLATRNHQFLDRAAMEQMLDERIDWRWRVYDDVLNLYVQCLKQPEFKDFFHFLEKDANARLHVFHC